MSGFTHRLTNRIRGPIIEDDARTVEHFLTYGWVDQPLWILRELHELAHLNLNFTRVGDALAFAEMRLDCAFYERLDQKVDPHPIAAAQASLSAIRDLLAPWSEAFALSTEWDCDLAMDHVPNAHRWLADLSGPDEYQRRLWRARCSPVAVAKKLNVLLSPSGALGGHLLGHLLARALSQGSGGTERMLALIEEGIYDDPHLASAILDLAEPGAFEEGAAIARDAAVKAFAGAAGNVVAYFVDGFPEPQAAAMAERGRLAQRLDVIGRELNRMPPRPRLFDFTLGDIARAYAYASRAFEGVVALGTAAVELVPGIHSVDLLVDGRAVGSIPNWSDAPATQATVELSFCVICGPRATAIRVFSGEKLLHISTDHPHLRETLRRAALASSIVETGQTAAALLWAMFSTPSDGFVAAAADCAGEVVSAVTGNTLRLSALEGLGIAQALARDREQLNALAFLSNTWPATMRRGSRDALPDAASWTNAQLAEFDAQLSAGTGLPLFSSDRVSVLW